MVQPLVARALPKLPIVVNPGLEEFTPAVTEPANDLYAVLAEDRYKLAWGERRLWWEVLSDAVKMYQRRGVDHTEVARRSAEEWFTDRTDWLGSFEFVCNILGLDAAKIRRAVLGAR